MVFPHGVGDLYHRYRPCKFKEVVGNKENIKSIKEALAQEEPARSYMLIGQSGCGKTTTARIMALAVNCTSLQEGEPCLECASCKTVLSGSSPDIIEVNAADTRGIDDARSLRASMSQLPMQLDKKVYILDEAQGLTSDAQSTLLKVLEEAPNHVFIILCTTDPQKLKATVKNRCQKFIFRPLPRKQILELLEIVATFETYPFTSKILELIADKSEGSPRNALVLLQQVAQLGFDSGAEIKALLASGNDEDPKLISLGFKLLGNYSPKWPTIASLYQELKHLGPESIWMFLAGYARNKLLKEKVREKAELYSFVLSLLAGGFPAIKPENQLVLNLYKIVEFRAK